MSFEKLSPELWSHVLSFLAPPPLAPLSGLTKQEHFMDEPKENLPDEGDVGTASRSDMRATASVNLMSTSIAFNHLASFHLYRNITTDRLPNLVYNLIAGSAHPDIASKRELLKKTRALHLEYGRKGEEPVYEDILRDSRQFFVVGSVTREEAATVQAVIEAQRLLSTLNSLVDLSPFPDLLLLSTGGVFGSQDALWCEEVEADAVTDFKDAEDELSLVIEASNILVETLFRQSPLTHLCQRGHYGPLALPDFVHWANKSSDKSPPPAPTFTLHFDLTAEFIAIAIGHRTRWILEQHERHRGVPELTEKVARAMDHALKGRKELQSSVRDFDLEVYCSSRSLSIQGSNNPAFQEKEDFTLYVDAETQRAVCSGMQGQMLEAWRRDSLKPGPSGPARATNDKLVWKASLDTPPCLACGGQYEQPEDPVLKEEEDVNEAGIEIVEKSETGAEDVSEEADQADGQDMEGEVLSPSQGSSEQEQGVMDVVDMDRQSPQDRGSAGCIVQ